MNSQSLPDGSEDNVKKFGPPVRSERRADPPNDVTLPSHPSSAIAPGDPKDPKKATEATEASPSKSSHSKPTAISLNQTIASQSDYFDASAAAAVNLTQNDLASDHPPTIGRYELKRVLGEGAFGRVYEAHDPQLDRRVAIKVAKAMRGATQIKRFLREARAAAQLRHPNIIPVYEYGQFDGQNIIVYEFVKGETLKGFIRRQVKIPIEQTIEIVRQIAEGLHYAHEQGIIHRDIKPDNVLIDSDGRPHIADFGCARSLNEDTSLTVDGSILGTPMYMSPEQASGHSSSADPRTDIWSLGVILYEMIGGAKPFGGSLNDLLFAICHVDAKPVRKMRSEAPLDLETICQKCLTRDLAQRLGSAQLLAAEISRHQRGEPILSRPLGPLQRTWLWAKRNQAVASLLAVVAVTLLIGTLVSTSFALHAYREKRQRAFAQLDLLRTAEANALPGIFESLKPFRSSILPQLKQELQTDELTPNAGPRLRMAMLELNENSVERERLAGQMVGDLLSAEADDFFVCRDCLAFHGHKLTDELWKIALDKKTNASANRKFRAAAALAMYDNTSPQWPAMAGDVAGYLASLNPIEMSHWLPSLMPIRELLKTHLVDTFHDRGPAFSTAPERAAEILARLFVDQTDFLTSLLTTATARQLPLLTEALRADRKRANEILISRLDALPADAPLAETANLIIALIQLGDGEQWSRFGLSADPSLATHLIETIGPTATPVEFLLPFVEQWETTDSDLLASFLLSLGQYQRHQILGSQKDELKPVLLAIFNRATSARVHASARWLLGQWNFSDEMIQHEYDLRREKPVVGNQWHVDLAGNTFVLFGPVDDFKMGLDPESPHPADFQIEEIYNEPFHHKQIPRRFGVCITEVTVGQYLEFETAQLSELTSQFFAISQRYETADADQKSKLKKEYMIAKAAFENIQIAIDKRTSLNQNLPVTNVDFFMSLAYCRWLSDQQQLRSGLPDLNDLRNLYSKKNVELGFSLEKIAASGYRLPTATEWELTCCGPTKSLFNFGNTAQFAERYAWFASNSDDALHPVAQLKPGPCGLFDQLGNADEWCLDWYREDLPPLPADRSYYVDWGLEYETHRSLDRECRGGSFKHESTGLRSNLRSRMRYSSNPIFIQPHRGFRLARSYELDAE